ncbi:hypothetical protein VYU27_003770 [Nannochloropsis oceanica]
MEGTGAYSTVLPTVTTGGSNEEHFNLLLQIQQLQDKCTYLAGGTNGVQLTEILIEKEEECRDKDRAMSSLEEEMNRLKEVLMRMEQEKAALQGLVHEQGVSITGLTKQMQTLSAEREELQQRLDATHAELTTTQASLYAIQIKADTSHSAWMRSEEQLAMARETEKALEMAMERMREEEKERESRRDEEVGAERREKEEMERLLQASRKEMRDLKMRLEENLEREQDIAQARRKAEEAVTGLRIENEACRKKVLLFQKEHQEISLRLSNARHEKEAQWRQTREENEGSMRKIREEKEECRRKVDELKRELKVVVGVSVCNADKVKELEGEIERMGWEKERVELERKREMERWEEEERRRREQGEEEGRERDRRLEWYRKRVIEMEGREEEMERERKESMEEVRELRKGGMREGEDVRAELVRIKGENEILRERVARQDAYLRRRVLKEGGGRERVRGGGRATMDHMTSLLLSSSAEVEREGRREGGREGGRDSSYMLDQQDFRLQQRLLQQHCFVDPDGHRTPAVPSAVAATATAVGVGGMRIRKEVEDKQHRHYQHEQQYEEQEELENDFSRLLSHYRERGGRLDNGYDDEEEDDKKYEGRNESSFPRTFPHGHKPSKVTQQLQQQHARNGRTSRWRDGQGDAHGAINGNIAAGLSSLPPRTSVSTASPPSFPSSRHTSIPRHGPSPARLKLLRREGGGDKGIWGPSPRW